MILWQWLRFPGDVLFAIAALLMAIDFVIKTRMFWSRLRERAGGAAENYTEEF
jgi:nitric oxide reductase subunit B